MKYNNIRKPDAGFFGVFFGASDRTIVAEGGRQARPHAADLVTSNQAVLYKKNRTHRRLTERPQPPYLVFSGSTVSSLFTPATPAIPFALASMAAFSAALRTGPRSVTVPLLEMILML